MNFGDVVSYLRRGVSVGLSSSYINKDYTFNINKQSSSCLCLVSLAGQQIILKALKKTDCTTFRVHLLIDGCTCTVRTNVVTMLVIIPRSISVIELHLRLRVCLLVSLKASQTQIEWAMSSSSVAKGQDTPGEDLSEGWGSTAESLSRATSLPVTHRCVYTTNLEPIHS